MPANPKKPFSSAGITPNPKRVDVTGTLRLRTIFRTSSLVLELTIPPPTKNNGFFAACKASTTASISVSSPIYSPEYPLR